MGRKESNQTKKNSWKNFLRKKIEKVSRRHQKHERLPRMQRVKIEKTTTKNKSVKIKKKSSYLSFKLKVGKSLKNGGRRACYDVSVCYRCWCYVSLSFWEAGVPLLSILGILRPILGILRPCCSPTRRWLNLPQWWGRQLRGQRWMPIALLIVSRRVVCVSPFPRHTIILSLYHWSFQYFTFQIFNTLTHRSGGNIFDNTILLLWQWISPIYLNRSYS